jgi:hypothetical protein
MNNTNSRYKIGIRGSGALAEVDNAGLIHFGNSKLLRWVIAGDDRWYDPSADASVRQTAHLSHSAAGSSVRRCFKACH